MQTKFLFLWNYQKANRFPVSLESHFYLSPEKNNNISTQPNICSTFDMPGSQSKKPTRSPSQAHWVANNFRLPFDFPLIFMHWWVHCRGCVPPGVILRILLINAPDKSAICRFLSTVKFNLEIKKIGFSNKFKQVFQTKLIILKSHFLLLCSCSFFKQLRPWNDMKVD